MKIAQHGSRDMPQPACDPMTFDSGTHPLRDDQSDARPHRLIAFIAATTYMKDHVGLHGAHPVPHRRIELG